MVDLSTRISKELSRALGAVVRRTGALNTSNRSQLKAAVDNLERTLREYDRIAEGLLSTSTDKEQLDKLVQSRVPDKYRNKKYKRLFWRTLYRTVPFLKMKKKTEDEVNTLSRLSLSAFSVIFRAIVAYSNAFIRQSASAADQDLETQDPEEFDPELAETISGMEKEVKPSDGKDQVQRKTDQNIKNQQRRSVQTPKAKDEEEFRSIAGQHEKNIDACRVALTRYESQLTKLLKFSVPSVFRKIQASAMKANDLGRVLNSIVADSRAELQPGTYITARGLLAVINATNTIIVQSVAQNRSQRSQLNKRLDLLNKQIAPVFGEQDDDLDL